ncbi:MAG: acetate--CoA ligase family protein [Candidatus Natronoplasma sp.]
MLLIAENPEVFKASKEKEAMNREYESGKSTLHPGSSTGSRISEGLKESLSEFFFPESIAVIGASPKPDKLSHVLLKNISASEAQIDIYPVNPKYDEIEGKKCYSELQDIPSNVDLAVISTPARSVPDLVEDCISKGVQGVVVISSGFSEVRDEEGRILEEKIKRKISGSETRLLGPNTLGFYVPSRVIDVMFLEKDIFHRPSEGGIGLISQSGSLGVDFLNEIYQRGVGLSLFVGLGNGLDLTEIDLIQYLSEDEGTNCISLYIENISDGERFFDVCKKAAKEKPIIVLKGGKSKKGNRAASLHTGKIGGEYRIIKNIFQQLNLMEADDEVEVLDYSMIFSKLTEPTGDNILILTNGGGNGILATDLITREWEDTLNVPPIPKKMLNEFDEILPDYISTNNPLDLSAEASDQEYLNALESGLSSDKYDCVLVGITVNQTITESLPEKIQAAAEKYEKPVVIYHKGFSPRSEFLDRLSEQHIPYYPSVRRAVDSLGEYMRWYHG